MRGWRVKGKALLLISVSTPHKQGLLFMGGFHAKLGLLSLRHSPRGSGRQGLLVYLTYDEAGAQRSEVTWPSSHHACVVAPAGTQAGLTPSPTALPPLPASHPSGFFQNRIMSRVKQQSTFTEALLRTARSARSSWRALLQPRNFMK